jgi:probable F420-dependent oxidoreductase
MALQQSIRGHHEPADQPSFSGRSSYIAARTTRIRLATNVLVLGYHHPLEIAKRYGTLDCLSGGRLILGLGVGSLKEEFDLLDAPFADRGARADDAVRALRASLALREPSYSGPYYRFEGMVVEPCAVQESVPLWMGGRTRRSLRRAAALADGWVPFALTLDQAAAMLADVKPGPGFEVVLSPERPLDAVDHPGDVESALDRLQQSGATLVNLTTVHHSLDHYLEQLHAFSELTQLS